MKRKGWMVGAGLVLWAATGWGAMEKVLCSTFPVYQLARNVAAGREGVEVSLLLPASMGCPHDYALTPQDMKKLASADVLVVNGLGLEEFLGAPVERANRELVVVDATAGVEGVMEYAEGPHDEEAHEGHEGHGHEGVNPHLFVSPRLEGKMAEKIAAGLSAVDPGGAEVYGRNARAYGERMRVLGEEMAALGGKLRNRRVAQPHGVFDYLARDMGLEVVASLQPHGQEPSAAEMIGIVRGVREAGAGAVLTEPQYSPRVGEMVAREAGIPVVMLDPTASGPEEAPLDHFETVMRHNMEILGEALGVE